MKTAIAAAAVWILMVLWRAAQEALLR